MVFQDYYTLIVRVGCASELWHPFRAGVLRGCVCECCVFAGVCCRLVLLECRCVFSGVPCRGSVLSYPVFLNRIIMVCLVTINILLKAKARFGHTFLWSAEFQCRALCGCCSNVDEFSPCPGAAAEPLCPRRGVLGPAAASPAVDALSALCGRFSVLRPGCVLEI
jgi:hypothetical protein